MPISDEKGRNYNRYWHLYVISGLAVAVGVLWNAFVAQVKKNEESSARNMEVLLEFARASNRMQQATDPENYDIVPVVDPSDSSCSLIAIPRRKTGRTPDADTPELR